MRLHQLAFIVLALLALTTCGSQPSGPEAIARQIMAADGYGQAQITRIVAGNPDTRGVDELYCVATDATTQNGELPYLLVVWRIGDSWDGVQLVEGFYEWDLQGCPR